MLDSSQVSILEIMSLEKLFFYSILSKLYQVDPSGKHEEGRKDSIMPNFNSSMLNSRDNPMFEETKKPFEREETTQQNQIYNSEHPDIRAKEMKVLNSQPTKASQVAPKRF